MTINDVSLLFSVILLKHSNFQTLSQQSQRIPWETFLTMLLRANMYLLKKETTNIRSCLINRKLKNIYTLQPHV